MGRIAEKFASLKEQNDKALITFITAGDPDLAATERLILSLEQAGADIVELGVPFSDPMADGPTIQMSSERALAAGTTLPKILATVKSVRSVSQVPIILMGYYNPIFLYGAGRFAEDAVAAGIDGVLIVDLPPEEAVEFKRLCAGAGLDVIFLLTPTSDEDRVAKVAQMGSGFLYYVSVAGVTGARTDIAANVFADLEKIKGRVGLPLAVGFGVSDPEQAGRLAGVADGVVVGSAIVKLFESFEGRELEERLSGFVTALKSGVSRRH
jgi:tryptophan synthase alpha chain